MGKYRERRRAAAGRWIERRFEQDRPCAFGSPNRQVRNEYALAWPRPIEGSITRGKTCCIGADQYSGGNAPGLEGRGQIQPVRTIEGISEGAKSRHRQHAADDRCFVPPPFSIHVVERRIRLCEYHVRMPI